MPREKNMIEWLMKAPRVSPIGYYFLVDPRCWGNYRYGIVYSGQYNLLELDSVAITAWIAKFDGPLAKKNAVSGILQKTEQHALHYILQNDLCSEANNKDDTLCRSDVTAATREGNSYFYVDLHNRTFDDPSYVCLTSIVTQSKNHHQTLRNARKLHQAKDLIQENQFSMIQAILNPFVGDDADLMNKLLLVQDKKGNTPLFYAYSKRLGDKCHFKSLLNRIGQLKLVQDKWNLLQADNQQNKKIIHVIVAHWQNLDYEIECFGKNLIKNALRLTDGNVDTPFHAVLSNPKPLSMVAAMCQIFGNDPHANQAGEEKNAHVPLEALFCQNQQELNPLHLLCQRNSIDQDTNTKIFDAWFNFLPRELFKQKLLEKDKYGCTPLHYAIKTGNDALVKKIFTLHNAEDINDDENEFYKKIAKIEDNAHETALHYACRFGNRETLKRVIEALGPRQLYEIRHQTNLGKLVPRQHHFSEADFKTVINKHNFLFNCFEYFTSIHPDHPFKNTNDFNNRIADFSACLIAIEASFNHHQLISLNYTNAFNKKPHLQFFRSARYANFRNLFPSVTPLEVEEFKEFIREKSSTAGSDIYQFKVAKILQDKILSIQLVNEKMVPSAPEKSHAPEPPPSYADACIPSAYVSNTIEEVAKSGSICRVS